MGTRQLKQIAYAQLSKALGQLKNKMTPLAFEQRKAVAEQALLRQIALEKAMQKRCIRPRYHRFNFTLCRSIRYSMGIFHALVAVGKSGQAGLAQVATPVGEALIMTGLGLAVAIPAVLAYNICVRVNRTLSNELQDHAHSLLIDTMLQQDSSAKKADAKVAQDSLVGGQA